VSFFFSVFTAFLIGAIPTGYLFGKYFHEVDIREHGSGNVGATNAFRVLGKRIGLVVFALDFAKGWVSSALTAKIFYSTMPSPEWTIWIGFGAILGHIFNPFLKFKGGKGIATGGGALCGSFPMVFLVVIGVWILLFALTRIVSVASLAAVAALIISSFILEVGWSGRASFILFTVLAVWSHRSNISRIFKGQEKKLISR
jgi:glycerol-3-phosphate acyltransferase PlsY